MESGFAVRLGSIDSLLALERVCARARVCVCVRVLLR